jgi:hypothetical protein
MPAFPNVRREEYAGPTQLLAVQSLASRLPPASGWRHAGDLAWTAACADKPEDCPTAIWREGDDVVAWGWLEGPGELTIQIDPRYPALAHEVLAWAEQAPPAGTARRAGSASSSPSAPTPSTGA